MKKQILSEELLRMKRLAGIISESQYDENKLSEGGAPEASGDLTPSEDIYVDYNDAYDIGLKIAHAHFNDGTVLKWDGTDPQVRYPNFVEFVFNGKGKDKDVYIDALRKYNETHKMFK